MSSEYEMLLKQMDRRFATLGSMTIGKDVTLTKTQLTFSGGNTANGTYAAATGLATALVLNLVAGIKYKLVYAIVLTQAAGQDISHFKLFDEITGDKFAVYAKVSPVSGSTFSGVVDLAPAANRTIHLNFNLDKGTGTGALSVDFTELILYEYDSF